MTHSRREQVRMQEEGDRPDRAQRQDPVPRHEIADLARAVEALRAGAISAEEFRRRRVIMGIYPVRGGPDRYLVRARMPLGRVSPAQLRALAETADRYASGAAVHLTTRQDVHIYGIEMARLADALLLLAEAGIGTREACGDTVRNVVTCPYAGISPDELFDVTPYAEALGSHLLRHPLGQRLPRKFKIAFDGCRASDHAGIPFHDVGVRAVLSPEGVPGFRIFAAGGLGALPRSGQVLEPFTPAARLVSTVEALLSVFERLGNRRNRSLARLKFVAEALGAEPFRQAVLAERAAMESSGTGGRPRLPEPCIVPGDRQPATDTVPAWPGALRQRQEGRVALPVRVPLGDLSPEQLRTLADVAENAGAGVRFTPSQGLVVADVPEAVAERVAGLLRGRGLCSRTSVSVVRCAGVDTCTVGITRVRGIAALLEETLRSPEASRVRAPVAIAVSGCPNGCGRHLAGDIGLRGVARDVGGRLAPHYMLHLGGGIGADGSARFGMPVGRVAARRAPQAVKRLLALLVAEGAAGESAGETFARLGKEPCAARLADLLEEPTGRYDVADFLDLGVAASEEFPPAPAGPRAP